jgi:DHA1 family multidrug resistance protein-like MFS transporter
VDNQISTLFLAAVISGLGGAMFYPASSGIISCLTLPEYRLRVVSIQKLINNVGIVLSAGLGSLLISFNFALLSLVCGSIYLILAIVSFFCLGKVETQPKKLSYKNMCHIVLGDRRFLYYTLISTGLWYLSMQLYLTVPLQAYAITGDKSLVPLVNMVVAVVVIFLQYPLINWLGQRLSLYNNIAAGALFLGTGLLIVGWSGSLNGLIIGLAVFACGIIIVEPTNFDITARMAKPEMSATYFGFASIAMAVGGGLSQVMGGWLFQQGPLLIWGSCVLATCLVLGGLQLLKKRYRI